MSEQTLTKQQKTALRYVELEGEAMEWGLWNWGVRPWPTFDNLVNKGLIERIEWLELSSEERGWIFRLTPLGLSYVGGQR